MRIIKLYTKKDKSVPQFFLLKRLDMDSRQMLVNYPISMPDRFRMARWFSFDEVSVDWIKTMDFVKE
jgi:hypothetical protein